ncbi:MAG: ankyrin repeat domain-containing protein [Planctomycetaceae bacterium]|nr:ankyrin repeat domain-containing protein [Planctomycetaceae bacterium]
MPRSTMPIRGLRDTAPFHWDGVPGDPYGGINSASIRRHVPPNSSIDEPVSTTRHVIDGGLTATMFLEGDETVNDEGKPGALSAAERDDMATFLLSVPYPPAQKRSYTNEISEGAARGFRLFHVDGDLDPSKARPNVCGNCHRLPFLVSTNTPGTGMDAPTWRGANDRFLILPQGRLNIIEFDSYERVAQRGIPERNVWQFSWGGRRRFDPVWDMVLEGSTGVSGSFARQVTLSKLTAKADLTEELLSALELSASEGAVVLEAEGVLIGDSTSKPVALQFDGKFNGGSYVEKDGDRKSFTRKELFTLAASGKFVGTFTARHGANADVDHPQPAIWSLGPIEKQRGRQKFPVLHNGKNTMTISGRHIGDNANIIVDGRRISGSVSLEGVDKIVVNLSTLPAGGMHLLQIQNAGGLFSNDFIFHVTKDAEAAVALQRGIDESHGDPRDTLSRAITKGDLELVKTILGNRARRINDRRPQGGSTPLSTAALHGKLDIARYLIKRGAKVDGTNNDGNTPLHVAAFMCRSEIVKLLLEKGASPLTKNKRGETAAGVVSGEWSEELAGFYTGIGDAVSLKVDLKRIERERPQIAKLIREQSANPKQDKEEAKGTDN